MSKNKSVDLRDHLFKCMEDLADPDANVDIERIKMMVSVADKIIDLAKVGVAHMVASDSRRDDGFISDSERPPLGVVGGGLLLVDKKR